jgi:hypothetical protein
MSNGWTEKTIALAALVVLFEFRSLAGGQEAAVNPSPAAPTNALPSSPPVKQPAGADQPGAPGGANITLDVLRMVQAGVAKDVIKLFIESAPVTHQLTAEELITLKERGVADDIATALLKRSAELRTQASVAGSIGTVQQSPPASGGRPLVVNPAYSGLDPESHDYFWYYYLHPRSLSAAYQRLGLYAPYPYGWSRPYGGFYPPMRYGYLSGGYP